MSKFTNSTFIYLISNVINAGIPFLLLPVLTRVLTEAEYGQLAMFQTVILGFSAITGLSVHGAANRKFFDNGITNKEISIFNGACVIILILSSFVVFVFLLLFSAEIEEKLLIPSYWLYSALFISISMFTIQLRLGQWQIRNKASKYAFFQLFQGMINISLSLLFVLYIYDNSLGRVNAQLVTALIFMILSILTLKKSGLLSFKFKGNKDVYKEAFAFGIPLIPHTIGVFFISSLDKIFITDNLGLEKTAIYMVALQLSLSMSIFFDSLNKAYVPWLFRELKKNKIEKNKNIVKWTYFYFMAVLFFSSLSFFIGPIVIEIIAGERYKFAYDVIGWLCLGQAFGGMYLMVTNYIFYTKKTGYLSIVTIVCGCINILLLLWLIPLYGILGAAYSFVIVKIIQFITTWIVAAKVYKMPWVYK